MFLEGMYKEALDETKIEIRVYPGIQIFNVT